MTVDPGEILEQVAQLHPRGPIRPEGLVIDGALFKLSRHGCQTCLTSWPCPTISTIGVNGGPGNSCHPDGAVDAPNKPKVAASSGTCSNGRSSFD